MFNYYIKMGLKNIRQTPVLSSLIVFAIALGIGTSMTMISYYQAMAYNPAGAKSDQLFSVQLAAYGDDMETWGDMPDGLPRQMTNIDSSNLRLAANSFPQSPLYRVAPVIESRRKDIAPSLDFEGLMVDRDFFSMFDVEFEYGGAWDASIDLDPAKQVVISSSLNDWIFGGGNNVGKSFVMADGVKEFTVVGISKDWNPQPVYYDLTGGAFSQEGPGLFLPFALAKDLDMFPQGNMSGWRNANVRGFADVLKSEYVWQLYWIELKTADEVAAYKDFLAQYAQEQQKLGRFANPNPRGGLKTVQQWLEYNEVISEDNRVMVGLSLLFLLVCLVNTVGLLMAKFLRKMNESGVRRALGANKGQIFNQYLVEVGLLGVLGGFMGLLLSIAGLWGVRILYRTDIAQLDLSLVLAAIGLSIFSALLTGIFPAYRVCNANPSVFLKAQ